MKTKNSPFFSICEAISSTCKGIDSLLWVLLNILSYALVILYAAGGVAINLSRGKNYLGKEFAVWPRVLKIGDHNWILPYHFATLGVCAAYIFDPALGLRIISRIFFAFAAFELLRIIISYLHKWTDEAGKPLWSSVEYEDEFYHERPFSRWGL